MKLQAQRQHFQINRLTRITEACEIEERIGTHAINTRITLTIVDFGCTRAASPWRCANTLISRQEIRAHATVEAW